jgi:hypothetical protein
VRFVNENIDFNPDNGAPVAPATTTLNSTLEYLLAIQDGQVIGDY